MRGKIVMGLAAVAILAGCGEKAPEPQVTKVTDPVLGEYTIVDNGIPQSLTGAPGDAAKGRAVVIHRQKGNCLACHEMPIPEEQFHGKIGPDLAGTGARQSEAELRLRMVDSKQVNADTAMPSFFRTTGFNQLNDAFVGKSILTAEEVEDVVAYLVTLK